MDRNLDREFPNNFHESSLSDPSVDQLTSSSDADETVYEVLKGVSTRGKDKLYDSKGYIYTLLKVNPSGSKLWRCHVRTKTNLCHASVQESVTGTFQRGLRDHNHSPCHGAMADAMIAKKTKAEAAKRVFDPAPAIVEEVIQELLPVG